MLLVLGRVATDECEFNADFCQWSNSVDDDLDWSLSRGSLWTHTGPIKDQLSSINRFNFGEILLCVDAHLLCHKILGDWFFHLVLIRNVSDRCFLRYSFEIGLIWWFRSPLFHNCAIIFELWKHFFFKGGYAHIDSGHPHYAGSKARLTSDVIPATGSSTPLCFAFWAHRFGERVGKLR